MALTPSWPGPDGLATTTDGRKALAGLVAKDAAGVARSGVFPAHTDELVTARSDMNVDIAAFVAAAVQFGGPVLFTNDGVAQLPSLLTSGSLTYFVVYAKQNEATTPGTDANDTGVFGAVSSTTSFTAARATLPTGAVELATVEMPAGKTATNQSGVIITQTFQYTAAASAPVLVRNQTEQDAWTPDDGATSFRLDRGRLDTRRGGAWSPGMVHAEWSFATSVADASPDTTFTLTNDAAASSSGFGDVFTAGSGQLTVSKAGLYTLTFSMSVPVTSASIDRIFVGITANGTEYRNESLDVGTQLALTIDVYVPAAGVVTLTLFQTSGATRTVSGRVAATFRGAL